MSPSDLFKHTHMIINSSYSSYQENTRAGLANRELRSSPFLCPLLANFPLSRLLGCTSLMSRILAMNFCSFTTRGHSPITLTFTLHRQLQITQKLQFPSPTALTQLFTLITHTPENHLTITITQSHTLYKLWTFSCSLPSIVSPAALQSVPSIS